MKEREKEEKGGERRNVDETSEYRERFKLVSPGSKLQGRTNERS